MTTDFTPVKYCPITGNNPMSCTEKGFWEACESFREKKTKGKYPVSKYKYCDICQGKEIPGKVTIINLEDAQIAREKQEIIMAAKKQIGTCYQCKKKDKPLRVHVDQKTCATCGIIRSKAKNNPAIVIAALEEFGNMPGLEADIVHDNADVIAAANITIAKLRQQLDEAAGEANLKKLRDKIKVLGTVNEGNKLLLSRIKSAMQTDNSLEDLPDLVGALFEDLDGIGQTNEKLRVNLAEIRKELENANEECAKLRNLLGGTRQELKDTLRAGGKEEKPAEYIQIISGYESLTGVLSGALAQAAIGKGKSRHAQDGVPFEQQKICRITRDVGLGYPLGQAMKKVTESRRLGDRGPLEILGAINYLAAAYLVMVEEIKAHPMLPISASQEVVMEM